MQSVIFISNSNLERRDFYLNFTKIAFAINSSICVYKLYAMCVGQFNEQTKPNLCT